MSRIPALVPALLLVLGSCSELVENTGEVCLVPKQLHCECLFPEDGFDCEFDSIPEDIPVVCTGTYPEGATYEVEAHLYEGGGGYVTKEKCTVEVEGDHLLVTGRFWHKPERDAIVEPGAGANCSVGPLAAGTWTLEFGGNAMQVEIGDAELVQDMVCVESMEQHSRSPR